MGIITDAEIDELLLERKLLPDDLSKHLKTKKKSHRLHEEKEIQVQGDQGHLFTIVLRKNRMDPKSFSIILKYLDVTTNTDTILTRYNGNHVHTNVLENQQIKGFHIHMATQRYQEQGLRIDGFARLTTAYTSYSGALDKFLNDLGFIKKDMERLEAYPGV